MQQVKLSVASCGHYLPIAFKIYDQRIIDQLPTLDDQLTCDVLTLLNNSPLVHLSAKSECILCSKPVYVFWTHLKILQEVRLLCKSDKLYARLLAFETVRAEDRFGKE